MGEQVNDWLSHVFKNISSLDSRSKIIMGMCFVASLVFYLVVIFFLFCLWETFRECMIGILTIGVLGGGGLAIYDMIDNEEIYISLIVIWFLLLIHLVVGLFMSSAVEEDYFDFEYAIIHMFWGIWSLARCALLLALFCTIIGIPFLIMIAGGDNRSRY